MLIIRSCVLSRSNPRYGVTGAARSQQTSVPKTLDYKKLSCYLVWLQNKLELSSTAAVNKSPQRG